MAGKRRRTKFYSQPHSHTNKKKTQRGLIFEFVLGIFRCVYVRFICDFICNCYCRSCCIPIAVLLHQFNWSTIFCLHFWLLDALHSINRDIWQFTCDSQCNFNSNFIFVQVKKIVFSLPTSPSNEIIMPNYLHCFRLSQQKVTKWFEFDCVLWKGSSQLIILDFFAIHRHGGNGRIFTHSKGNVFPFISGCAIIVAVVIATKMVYIPK